VGNVVVTGARGFIGRHLARALAARGDIVLGIGNGRWENDEAVSCGVSLWLDGPVSRKNLACLCRNVGSIDYVFHLAGGSSVAASIANPRLDFDRSVLSSLEVLDWIRSESSNSKLILASSAAVYGAGYFNPINELQPPMPSSPYGVNKLISEQLSRSYAEMFDFDLAIIRLFSVYGEGIRKQLLWDICSRLSSNPKRLQLGGTGLEIRDWLHVEDAVNILLSATAFMQKDSPIILNGATSIPVTVSEIAQLLCKEWGNNTQVIFSNQTRRGDPPSLLGDSSMLEKLSIFPKISLEDGIRRYVRWFRKNHVGAKECE